MPRTSEFPNPLRTTLQRSWWLFQKNRNPWPEGDEGLKYRSHRQMVGGMFDKLGKFQFNFMIKEGLKQDHVLLDIGCGSLRAGKYFIAYLNSGNYLGIDKQEVLIQKGKTHEIDQQVLAQKKPEFVISSDFDFFQFSKKPDFVLAQSLFIHLCPRDIKHCLSNLSLFCPKHCRVYATFCEAPKRVINILPSHSGRRFEYTPKQMAKFGKKTGWKMQYIGDWGHPRNQKFIIYYK